MKKPKSKSYGSGSATALVELLSLVSLLGSSVSELSYYLQLVESAWRFE